MATPAACLQRIYPFRRNLRIGEHAVRLGASIDFPVQGEKAPPRRRLANESLFGPAR